MKARSRTSFFYADGLPLLILVGAAALWGGHAAIGVIGLFLVWQRVWGGV